MKKGEVKAYNNICSDWKSPEVFLNPRVNTCENGGKMKCISMVFNRATGKEDEMWHVGTDPGKGEN